MNENEQDQHTQPEGRIFHTTVYGDNAAEIEMAALDAAREFFGEGALLQIVDDYQVIGVWNEEGRASEKKYDSVVRVRAVNR